eukprot:365406-Chlamydomonas_euryale.AAC.3
MPGVQDPKHKTLCARRRPQRRSPWCGGLLVDGKPPHPENMGARRPPHGQVGCLFVRDKTLNLESHGQVGCLFVRDKTLDLEKHEHACTGARRLFVCVGWVGGGQVLTCYGFCLIYYYGKVGAGFSRPPPPRPSRPQLRAPEHS